MKALVLAGGFPQIALINNLKHRGIEVVLADYNEEPVAKKYADKFSQTSTLDVEAIKALATKEAVDFLITVCTDQALLTVAKVSEDLGLPCYIDYQTALNVTNKQYMKKKFADNNIMTAQFVVLRELDEKAIEKMNYPLIVKPVDCNSSKGVKRCNNYAELKKYFTDAVKFSRTNTAIIEEFINGKEVSVDVYVQNGKAHVLCVSNSDKIAEKDKFVIFRTIYPAAISQDVYQQIEMIAQQIADAFEIHNSPMLIQFLIDGQKAYVIEFSARTGGGVKYLLIERTSGFDVIDAVVELTLGNSPYIGQVISKYKYIVNDFVYCEPGVFDHLEGFDELQADGILDDYYLFKWRGAVFGDIRASGDRIAGYTVMSNLQSELIKKHNLVSKRIKAISKEGKDIIRHDLLVPLCEKDGFIFTEE